MSAPAGFSYPALVDEIRTAGITTAEIARVTGVQLRQVQHWASGTSRPREETRDRLVDVHYLVRQLSQVYKPEGIEIWIHSRNPILDGQRPIDLLQAGEFGPVVDLVDSLTAGNT